MQITYCEKNRRFEANLGVFPEFLNYVPVVKHAKFSFDPETKIWHTDNPHKVEGFEEFCDEAALAKLNAGEEKDEEMLRLIALSKATDYDGEFSAPEGLEYLPFQKAGIAYAMKVKDVIIADDMGLGKTIQAIGVINEMKPQKVLVVCPASLRLNWKKELDKWLVDEYDVGLMDERDFATPSVMIISYASLKTYKGWLNTEEFDLLICDESHYLKNKNTQRTQNVLGKYRISYFEGKKSFKTLVHPIKAEKRLFLTGTPILNRPKEIFSVANACAPGTFPDYSDFALRYCGAYTDEWGHWQDDGASHLDELQDKLRGSCMVRRVKDKEILKDLPAKRRVIIEIPKDEKTIKIINYEKKHVTTESFNNAVRAMEMGTSANFEDMTEVRMNTALEKVPMVIQHAKNVLEQVGKVIIFAHHHAVIDALYKGLSDFNPVKFDGRDEMTDKDLSVNEFQDGNARVFIGSINAAGHGITLSAASHIIFAEMVFTPGIMTQCEDRAHRIGQKSSVIIEHLILQGTIDATMAKMLVDKQEILDKTLNHE